MRLLKASNRMMVKIEMTPDCGQTVPGAIFKIKQSYTEHAVVARLRRGCGETENSKAPVHRPRFLQRLALLVTFLQPPRFTN